MDARTHLPDEQRKLLDAKAREIVHDSIVEKATVRLVAQISAEYVAIIHELNDEIARLKAHGKA